MKRPMIIIGILIGLVIFGALGWYLAGPLFYDRTVDEDFPLTLPSPAELAAMSEAEKEAMAAKVLEAAAAMPAKEMSEPMPEAAAEPKALQRGQFKDADAFHKGAGQATIYELPDGTQVLRLEDFSTTNGPDLHVLLAAHPDPTSRSEIEQGYLDLGSLKGNIGNQNYDLPAGTDLSTYHSVVIYCMPFHVIFSTATLN